MDQRKPRERLLVPALRSQPDRRLVALARDGSEPAQEEIVRRYRAPLVRYAGSIAGPAAAEDVVQEALAKATAALGGAGEELRLRPWLYAIVRNTALNHLRDAGPATAQLDESYDGVEQPPQALERRERVRSLVGGLRRLPRQQREALVKRELEGRSHDEIGAELGVSSGAARQLIFRARESLRVGFGSLLPMPLLRWLAENGGDSAAGVAAGAGGGALAAKAAVAVFAAGAAVTAGVAIDHGATQRPGAAGTVAVRPAVAATGGGAVGERRLEPVAAEPGSGRDDSAVAEDGHGRGESSGRGPGDGRAVDGRSGGGPGPSAEPGPGSSGDGGGSGGHGRHSDSSHSGRDGGSGGTGGDDGGRTGTSRSGSGHSGDGSGSGSESGWSRDSGSGSSGGSGSTSGGSGSSGGGSTSIPGAESGGGSSGGSSSGGGGGGGSEAIAPSPATAPTPSDSGSPAPAPVESGSGGSGSSGSSGTSSEVPRDLSGNTVSQGSYDPD